MIYDIKFSNQNIKVEADSIVTAIIKIIESGIYDSDCTEFDITKLNIKVQ